MLSVGVGKADIIPQIGQTTLGGFSVRNNQPTNGVHAPIQVRALVFESKGEFYYLLNYDLLGVGAELEEIIYQNLEQDLGDKFDQQKSVITATHTHSAPPALDFAGLDALNLSYLAYVGQQTVAAVRMALVHMQAGDMFMAQKEVTGLTYNRRSVLVDGRVSIKLDPGVPVVERGPLDTTFTLLVWKNSAGQNLAAAVHFPVHGVSVLTQKVTSDIPGAISRGFEDRLGVPCLFLQGTTGDINPIITRTDGGEKFRNWVAEFFDQVENVELELEPVKSEPLVLKTSALQLSYAQPPTADFLAKRIDLLQQVAAGDFTSDSVSGIIPAIRELTGKNPGEMIDPVSAKQTAALLVNCDQNALRKIQADSQIAPPPLKVACLKVGGVIFVFVAAEVFATTGLQIKALADDLTVLPIGYSSRLLGYLPDDDSMDKGGYEADYSWRLYLHSAPFAKGSESLLINAVNKMIGQIL